MDRRDQEVAAEHGSTVLPGVPLPPNALPHGPIQPEGVPAPEGPPAPVVEAFPGAPEHGPAAVEGASVVPVAAAAPRTPWWKKEIGGTKKPAAAAAAPPAAAGPPAVAPAPVQPVPPVDPSAAVVPAAAVAAAPRGRHAAPAPEPQSRRTLVLLLVLGLALVVVAVLLFVWPGLLVSSGDDEAAGAAPSGGTVSLVVPATLAGLTKLSGKADDALSSTLEDSDVEGLSDPVSGVYGTGTTPVVQVIAWKAVDPPAQDSVDAAFTGFESSSGADVTAVEQLPTGDLGGLMACGSTTVQDSPAVQCFWADASSFGSITVLDPKDRAAAHATALQVRAGVEKKG